MRCWMSAIGTKRTYRVAPHMSGKADMTFCIANVCFGPKADIRRFLGWRRKRKFVLMEA